MARIIELTQYKKSDQAQKYTIQPKVKVGVSTLGLLTVVIIFFLSILYLIQANKTATYGFEIKEYDQKIKVLEEEKKNLEFDLAKLKSTSYVKENLTNLNMTEIDPNQIVYYKIKINEVALDK